MGGKTQRTAGNVKPSSSGRIRELLINKHGMGNVITFSALSNNSQQQTPPTPQPAPKADGVDDNDVGCNQKPTETQCSTITPPSNDDGPALIVKRIGNRDCFTRVRRSKDLSESTNAYRDENISDDGASKVGRPRVRMVFKFEPNEQQPFEGSTNTNEDQLREQEETAANEKTPEAGDGHKVYDFDSLLDQLTLIQDSRHFPTAESLIDSNEGVIVQECELMKVLNTLIREFNQDMSIQEWDLVSTSLENWTDLISRTPHQLLADPIKANFCINVFNLIHQLILLAKTWKEKTEASVDEQFPMMHALLDDWNNFYSSKVYHDLITLYFKLTTNSSLESENLAIIEALANIVADVDPKMVISNGVLIDHPKAKAEFEPESELPSNSRFCTIDEVKFKGFLAMCGLFNSNHRIVSVSAHAMLSSIMDYLCENIQHTESIDQDDNEKFLLFPPAVLMSILTSRDSMMSALLSDYRVGDISVTIEPNSDSYTCTLVYLFVWDLVIQFIVRMDKQVAHRIIHGLKKQGLIQRLLDTVFMLLPPLGERDSLNFRVETNGDDTICRRQWSLSDFLKAPLKASMKRPVNEIELTALHIYFSIARHMPVTVRKWYNNNSNKRLCNLVNEYTVKHVSSVICSLEMETVQEKCQERANEDKMNNLVIKARPNAKEVYAVYTRDEFRMELTIKLPTNYPLGSVQIDGGRRVGVTDVKWRSWLLQLTTFLSHQNGPILDGIDLWRKNIDKKFEGIEKCTICYSILHSNYQLPKKKCQTCSHMFHSLCLYKWFETSLNTTCPLCRNNW